MIAIEQRPLLWPLCVPALSGRVVHVWNAELRVLEQRYEQLAGLLSLQDQQRANGYKLPAHQRRFRMVRGALRALLGAYLHRDAAGVELGRGPEGKPMLAARTRPPLHFNVSHSCGLAVLSFCEQTEVGVDVEYLDAKLDVEVVANTTFPRANRRATVPGAPSSGCKISSASGRGRRRASRRADWRWHTAISARPSARWWSICRSATSTSARLPSATTALYLWTHSATGAADDRVDGLTRI